MNTLKIEWRRLVNRSGETRPRCLEDGRAVDAAAVLRRTPAPAGIRVMTRKTKISPEAFAENPIASNEIRINGKTP